MLLSEILADFEYTAVGTVDGMEIADIVYDSRRADAAGCLFVCLVGAKLDGHNFAGDMYEKGCRAFLCERELALPADAVQVIVPDARTAMALASAAFFGYPARSLAVIGITGTKGKTTTGELTRAILAAGGIETAYIGTTGILIKGERTPTKNTTPESYELHRAFRRMVDAGVAAVVMEVSSQAVYMRRIAGIRFHIGVFTNLSRDHIGGVEHPTFEHYMQCKSMLFSQCRYGILNADDPYYTDMLKNARSINTTFGMAPGITHGVGGRSLGTWREGNALGERFAVRSAAGEFEYRLKLPGSYNIYNALAAIAVAERMQVAPEVIGTALRNTTVCGRFELIDALPDAVTVIDYAHNRASMEAALRTLRSFNPRRLVVLFGSIGERAKERRAEQAQVVSAMADFAIITSDNPGTEPPEDIIAEIASHMEGCPFVSFVDRREAVKYAIDNARGGDVILFAGKGHETYQIVNGEYVHYDEREAIAEAAAARIAGAVR